MRAAGRSDSGSRLTVEDVTVSFGSVRALNGLSLDIAPGTRLGVIGPNGAGKSTLVGVIGGRVIPDTGCVSLGRNVLTKMRADQRLKAGVAQAFQQPAIFGNLTVEQNVLIATHGGRVRVAVVLEEFGLAGKWNVKAGALSYGEQKRLDIARAMASESTVLMCDEPGAGLNAAEKRIIGGILLGVCENRAITLVLIDHNVELIRQCCERVVVLESGSILYNGSVDEALSDSEVIRAFIGDGVHG